MKDNGKTITEMEKEYLFGQMGTNSRASGKKTKLRVRVYLC